MILRLGTGWEPPLRGSVLFKQLLRFYLSNFGRFFAKHVWPIHCPSGEKDCGPNFILAPSNQVVFKGGVTFPELRGIFQN